MCAHVCIVCRGDKMNVHRCMFKGCMCVPYTWCACGGQKTACGNQFCPTTWLPRMELRLSGSVASSFLY